MAAEADSGSVAVLMAHGLGGTEPVVPPGEVTKEPAPVVQPLEVLFQYLAENRGVISEVLSQPLYAGLAPGYVGVYQVNLRLPDAPPSLPACPSGLYRNLRITLLGTGGSDSIEICVKSR